MGTPGLFAEASFVGVSSLHLQELMGPGDDVMWAHGWAALFRLFL